MNPSTWEAETESSIVKRSAWVTQQESVSNNKRWWWCGDNKPYQTQTKPKQQQQNPVNYSKDLVIIEHPYVDHFLLVISMYKKNYT
jgi:hypothetical protein